MTVYKAISDLIGNTPLVNSINKSYNDISKFLIENNANINDWDDILNSPLKIAIDKENFEIAELLVAKGIRFMKSKIIWSKKSKTSLIEIKEYFTENASPRIANRLVKEIINKAQLLLETPFAGQKDPFLEFKNQDFRYLIFKNYKLVYRVENQDLIKIYEVFDCRQDPEKIENISK